MWTDPFVTIETIARDKKEKHNILTNASVPCDFTFKQNLITVVSACVCSRACSVHVRVAAVTLERCIHSADGAISSHREKLIGFID